MGTRLARGSSVPLLQGSERSLHHPCSAPRHSYSALKQQEEPRPPHSPHSPHSLGGHRGTWRASRPPRTARPTMVRQTAMLTTWHRKSIAGLARRAHAPRLTAPAAGRTPPRTRCPCPSRAATRAPQRLQRRGEQSPPAPAGWPRGRLSVCPAVAQRLRSQTARDSCGRRQQRDGSLLRRRCSCPTPPRPSERSATSSPWWGQWNIPLMKT